MVRSMALRSAETAVEPDTSTDADNVDRGAEGNDVEEGDIEGILDSCHQEAIESLGHLPAPVQQHAVIILTKAGIQLVFDDAWLMFPCSQAIRLVQWVSLSDQLHTAFKIWAHWA